MKVLCVFGRNAYGDPVRGPSPEFRFFIPALERLGHEVVFFDSLDRRTYRDHAELNAALLRTVDAEKPQAMLFVPLVAEVWLETLWIIRNRGNVATICWTTDDSWKYEQQSKFIAPAFDAIATTYPSAFAKYREAGLTNVVLSQWAAPADALQPPLPASECEFEVTFVGACHGNRKQRMDWLAKQGIGVECFGFGWSRGPVSSEEMNDIIRRSRISLNFANSQGENQIKARMFEVPGAGGFLLTEEAPRVEEFYRVGEEIDCFHTVDELAAKIRRYTLDPSLRDRIANAGFQRTKRDHTYDLRLKELLEAAMKSKRSEPERAPSISMNFDDAVRRYRIGMPHRLIRSALLFTASILVGRSRAQRAARRLVYELSYRLRGSWTYTASGWPGRLFPDV